MKNPILALFLSSLFSSFFISPGAWGAPRSFDQFTIQLKPDYTFHVPGLYPTFSIDEIVARSTDYEDFLKRLPPELFNAPVLIHASGSLQASSLERPRAILYGAGALISLSEPANTKKRTVEILRYNDGDFSALEITFDGRTKTTDASGRTCTACHGEALRPVWFSYDLWPTMYGSFAGLTSSDKEKAALANVLKSREGVYKYLRDVQDESGKIRGNDNLTILISNMLHGALAKSLSRAKAPLMPWRYALMAAFKGCSGDSSIGASGIPITEFVPPGLRSRLPLDASVLHKSMQQTRVRKTALQAERYRVLFGSSYKNLDIEPRLDIEIFPIADTRYLLESFGFSLRPYQMTNGLYDYSMSLPTNFPLDWSAQSVRLFPEVFKELKPSVTPGITWPSFDCKDLKKRSLAELANVTTLPVLESGEREVAPMARCISCHAVGGKAPAIPFDDSMAFAKWMRTDDHYDELVDQVSSARMPKNAILSADERASLLSAFARIKEL
jgi:hypothetical protein